MELRKPRVTAFLVGLILTFVLAAPMWGQPGSSFTFSEEATTGASTLGLPAWLTSWWEELCRFAGTSDGGPRIDLDGVALDDGGSAESFTSDPTEEEDTTEGGPRINIDG